jgi:hypothetical protein
MLDYRPSWIGWHDDYLIKKNMDYYLFLKVVMLTVWNLLKAISIEIICHLFNEQSVIFVILIIMN